MQKATSIWQLLQPLEKCKCQVHMECDKKVNSARQTTKRHQGPFVQTSTWLKRQDANNTCLHITSWKRTQDGAQVFNMLRSLNWLIMAAFASIEIFDRITEVLTYILSVNNQELKITGRMWHCLDTIGNHTCQGNILCVHRFLWHDIAYNTGKLGLHRCSRRTKEKPEPILHVSQLWKNDMSQNNFKSKNCIVWNGNIHWFCFLSAKSRSLFNTTASQQFIMKFIPHLL